MKKNLSILFSSYGDYQELLPITYHFFNKFWPENNYKVYWGSNGKYIENFADFAPDWFYLHTNENDLGWSENLKSYLQEIETDYVLLLLDDFLLLKEPDYKAIDEGLDLMQKIDAVYLRLNNKPPADKKIYDIFGSINYYSDYRSSLQPAIWKKDVLLKICEYKFNPWLFEWKAGIVDETINEIFLGVFKDIINTQHCIEKGMWIENVLSIIKNENIRIDSNRQIWINDNQISKNTLKEKFIKLIPKIILFHLRKVLKKGIFSDNFTGHSHK